MDPSTLQKVDVTIPVVGGIAFVKVTLRDSTTGLYFYIVQEMEIVPYSLMTDAIEAAANDLGYTVTNMP